MSVSNMRLCLTDRVCLCPAQRHDKDGLFAAFGAINSDMFECFCLVWQVLASTIALMSSKDTISSHWPTLLIRGMLVARLLWVLFDLATPYTHFLAHHLWWYLRKLEDIDQFMGLSGSLRLFAFFEHACEVFNGKVRRLLVFATTKGGVTIPSRVSELLPAANDARGRGVRRQAAMLLEVARALYRDFMMNEMFEKTSAVYKATRTASKEEQQRDHGVEGGASSYASATGLAAGLDAQLHGEWLQDAAPGCVISCPRGVGLVVDVSQSADEGDVLEVCLFNGEQVHVPAAECAVDRPEEDSGASMLQTVFGTDEEDRFEYIRRCSLAERADAAGGSRKPPKALTLRSVCLGGRERNFKELGFGGDSAPALVLNYSQGIVALHGPSATGNSEVAIWIKPRKICCEDSDALCVQARAVSYHAKKASNRWDTTAMPVDPSTESIVTSKCLWQFYVKTMPSTSDIAPIARVCALQDMCRLDEGYPARAPCADPSSGKGAQSKIPIMCSHPSLSLEFAKAMVAAANDVEIKLQGSMKANPVQFKAEDAPLELVHKPFAARARRLEDAFHAKIVKEDALYTSRPRVAQDGQDSDSGSSGGDED